MVSKSAVVRGPLFPSRPFVLSYHLCYEAESLLIILFLLLLNVAFALCTRGNISAVCISYLRGCPSVGLPEGIFPSINERVNHIVT